MEYNNSKALVPVHGIHFTEEEREFQRECLDAHNLYRALHGSPPLILCDQLCSYATNWAMELADYQELVYSPTNTLGENLYMADGVRVSGMTPVRAWYNEVRDYNYKLAKFSPHTGHFTQIIWKDSRELGVGYVHTDTHSFVVCSYYPPGNETGSFRANVLEPQKTVAPLGEGSNIQHLNQPGRSNRMVQGSGPAPAPSHSRHDGSNDGNNRNKAVAEDEVTLFFLGILLTLFISALLMMKAG